MRLLFAFMCVFVIGLATQSQAQNNCDLTGITDQDWLSPDPTTLAEVRNGLSANNCDFHIFSWQWFSYLMNPASGSERVFEDRSLFPVVDLDTCTSVLAGTQPDLAHGGVIAGLPKQPDIADQASGNALYDKNGNIVFYNRTFTPNECGILQTGNFPDAGGASSFPTGKDQVVELKTAWRILDPTQDNSAYYTQAVTLAGEGDQLLGLIGFHIVMNTALHPEFVWATFEHVDNVPNCTVNTGNGFQRPQPAGGWTLVSPSCNACVASNYSDGTDLLTTCASACDWNPSNHVQPAPAVDSNGDTIISGAASDICLIEYLGTSSTQSGADTNIANIEYLNTLLAGPGGLFATSGGSEMAVLQNYYLGGAVWTDMSTFNMGSTDPFSSDMAGSHALANASMESFSQPNSNSSSFFDTGCFSCHGGATPQNTADASHLLTASAGAAPGLMDRCNVKAGPLYSQADADTQCPTTCGSSGNWNGNWTTTSPGSMSVCGCNSCPSN